MVTAAVATAAPPNTALVAVIAGNSTHRNEVAHALTSFYRVAGYGDASQALEELERTPPCVVVVDEMVPPFGGLAVVRRLRERQGLRDVPIICTAVMERMRGDPRQLGADAFLGKPFRRSALIRAISGLVNKRVEGAWDSLPAVPRESLKRTIDVFNGISDLIDKGEPLAYRAVQDACAPLVDAVKSNDFKVILSGVKDHDNYSYVHSLRVATFLSLFGYTVGLKGDDLALLASGGLVHDIGKMFIPHEVLNKPGKLVDKEWDLMKSHVARTSDYLRGTSDVPRGVLTIAEQHHEKLDGTGYPRGIGQLNELARMASIADVFGALTDRRCYKPPMAPEEALKIMTEDMKPALDQHLLAMFREMLLDAAAAGPIE
ncbi:MAG: HD-GYP domain-containing protein [Solirubrobacterales bacterium]